MIYRYIQVHKASPKTTLHQTLALLAVVLVRIHGDIDAVQMLMSFGPVHSDEMKHAQLVSLDLGTASRTG